MKLNLSSLALAALCAAAVHAKPESSAQILKADVLRALEDSETKLISLAEAMPDDKLGYRPAEGVRSAAEVFMHVAGANYFISTFIGAKTPEGFSQAYEKSATEKAKVVEELKKSFGHLKAAIGKLTDADLIKPIKLFGHDAHQQTVLLVLAGHAREHLGQAIAYARANGIVPPWSKGKEG